MTKTKDRFWVRVLEILLCGVLAAGGAFFTACSAYWRSGMPEEFADSDFAKEYVWDCMYYLEQYAEWEGDVPTSVAQGYGGSCFGCRLTVDGSVVLDTTDKDSDYLDTLIFYRCVDIPADGTEEYYDTALRYGPYTDPEYGTVIGVYSMPAAMNASGESAESSGETADTYVMLSVEREYTLEGFLNYPIEPYSGLYAEYTYHQAMRTLKSWAMPLAVLCFALAAALAYTLARDALRRRKLGADVDPLARLPFDAFAAGVLILTAILYAVTKWPAFRLIQTLTQNSCGLNWRLNEMARGMLGAFWWTAAGVTLLCSVLARDWRSDPGKQLLLSRVSAEARILFPLAVGIVFAVLGAWQYSAFVFLVGLVLIALSGVFSALLFRQLRQLRAASERLAAGELDSKVGEERFWPGVREQAAALDRIGDGIKAAVDEQLKGERLKTELITNVSHDLKTPVTSIVSCADLLKRPDTTPEQTAEYLDMLERQSRKLQKLTDDLLEASKASSGAIDVQKEPTDVRELLNQSVGEFAERLEQRHITPVLALPDEPCILDTDGQLLWRILDNLLGNICKYAQPDTRAYVGLETSPSKTVISLKNTSASPLNISAEALMERFVRGDSSRSTEGSGLGLSIAQSLTRLLGGELALQIDGDLFKAEIRFAAPEAEK